MQRTYRPRYRAEIKQAATHVEIDRLRKMKKVFIDSGLENCSESKKLDEQITDKLMKLNEYVDEARRQHSMCGCSLLAAFIALDLLTECLYDMEKVFGECAILDAKDVGIDFAVECRKLAEECNRVVCYVGRDNYVDEKYGELSVELVEELKDRIEEVVKANKYRIIR